MPLTSAIQSAMAVRAEREKRHQRRLSKIRRESGAGAHARGEHGGGARGEHSHGHGASLVCTKRQSVASTGTLEEAELRPPPDKADSMVTTFHLGIVFILLGFIMILSSMIPSTIIKADWSRLLGVGLAFIFIGLMMVMVNRIITARQEEELAQYVKQRLSRTRSGTAFTPRDCEGGGGPGAGGGAGSFKVPDIVKPPQIPSAMKGHNPGGTDKPPRSPKDKVTFAEFPDVKTLGAGDTKTLCSSDTKTLGVGGDAKTLNNGDVKNLSERDPKIPGGGSDAKTLVAADAKTLDTGLEKEEPSSPDVGVAPVDSCNNRVGVAVLETISELPDTRHTCQHTGDTSKATCREEVTRAPVARLETASCQPLLVPDPGD